MLASVEGAQQVNNIDRFLLLSKAKLLTVVFREILRQMTTGIKNIKKIHKNIIYTVTKTLNIQNEIYKI